MSDKIIRERLINQGKIAFENNYSFSVSHRDIRNLCSTYGDDVFCLEGIDSRGNIVEYICTMIRKNEVIVISASELISNHIYNNMVISNNDAYKALYYLNNNKRIHYKTINNEPIKLSHIIVHGVSAPKDNELIVNDNGFVILSSGFISNIDIDFNYNKYSNSYYKLKK